MAKKLYIERLTKAIEAMHHCRAKWVATGPIKETSCGKTIWEGDVETFVLIGHPKARRAFAWGQSKGPQSKEERFTIVLEVPPVNSPQMAVKVTIAENRAQLAVLR